MSEIILHHYQLSPYSEKIRLALGLKGQSWRSVEIPVWPCAIRKRKRALVSSAVPKPAIWRIVQGCARYIVGYGPRVYGGWPGNPTSAK